MFPSNGIVDLRPTLIVLDGRSKLIARVEMERTDRVVPYVSNLDLKGVGEFVVRIDVR